MTATGVIGGFPMASGDANIDSGGAADRGDFAGLVPSKTTVTQCVVNLAPSAVAERRIKRLKRSVWQSGKWHEIQTQGRRPARCWFVTLTYRGVSDWRPDHIKEAINAFRRWCKSVGAPCAYTWVAELQGRGAVHYHLLAWLPRHLVMPQWDRSKGNRAAFWPHGMTNTQKALAGVGYLMKYLSKLGELTRFPKGLRLYGIGGINSQGRALRAWHNLPEWVKRCHGVGDVVRKKWGLLVQATGEILAPAFRVSIVPSGLLVQAVRALPERFHCGPYSTYPRCPV